MVSHDGARLPAHVREAITKHLLQQRSGSAISTRDGIKLLRRQFPDLAGDDGRLVDEIAKQAVKRGIPVDFDNDTLP